MNSGNFKVVRILCRVGVTFVYDFLWQLNFFPTILLMMVKGNLGMLVTKLVEWFVSLTVNHQNPCEAPGSQFSKFWETQVRGSNSKL